VILAGLAIDDADSQPSSHSGVVERMLLLWAISLSAAFALLVTKLVGCRRAIVDGSFLDEIGQARRSASGRTSTSLKFPRPPKVLHGIGRSHEHDGRSSPEDDAFGYFGPSDGTPSFPNHQRAASPLPWFSAFAFTTATIHSNVHAGQRLQRHCLRPLLMQFLALVEAATAWVTGNAWIDALKAWTPLAEYPTPGVAATDIGISWFVTLATAIWLILSGRSGPLSDEKKGSREEVELFFATNASSFLVGFSWVSVCRDLSTMTAELLVGHAAIWLRYATLALCTFAAGPLPGLVAVMKNRR
jgi:hypothetical protein